MALPPEVLRIKRKRTDEPIDSLYIESNEVEASTKRRTFFKDWVFRRAAKESASSAQLPPLIPKILATQPGDERKGTGSAGNGADTGSRRETPQDKQSVTKTEGTSRRQFHLSRPSAAKSVGKRKERGEQDEDIAVLVESPMRRQKLMPFTSGATHGQRAASPTKQNGLSSLKRPGAAARVVANSREPNRKVSAAPDPRIQDAMLRYAAEADDKAGTARSNLRNEQADQHQDAILEDASMLESDDGDYVYDTFVRHSAESLAKTEAERVGYLVIDEEDKDLWEMYADDGDESEKDWDSEQDDENAENYYGADYPEEEVDFDDEYGEDAYQYRKAGASDDEEFDENDAWSDEDVDAYGSNDHTARHKSDSLRTPMDLDDKDFDAM